MYMCKKIISNIVLEGLLMLHDFQDYLKVFNLWVSKVDFHYGFCKVDFHLTF